MAGRQDYGGTSDDMVSVGRAIVEQLAALRLALVDVARPDAPGAYLGTTIAAGASSFTIGLPADAALVEIDMALSAGTAGSDLHARFTQGGVPVSGATDYFWANLKAATHTTDLADPQMVIGANFDDLASSLYFRITRPAEAVRHYMSWNGSMLDSTTGAINTLAGAGKLQLNTNAVDGVQFLFSAGLVGSVVYSVRYSGFTT